MVQQDVELRRVEGDSVTVPIATPQNGGWRSRRYNC